MSLEMVRSNHGTMCDLPSSYFGNITCHIVSNVVLKDLYILYIDNIICQTI